MSDEEGVDPVTTGDLQKEPQLIIDFLAQLKAIDGISHVVANQKPRQVAVQRKMRQIRVPALKRESPTLVYFKIPNCPSRKNIDELHDPSKDIKHRADHPSHKIKSKKILITRIHITLSTKQKLMSTSPSILIIGATGGTGIACIEQLSNHKSKPTIHAFCRDPAKVSNEVHKRLTTVQKGNARKAEDIEKALENTKADWIIISVGNGENVAKNDIRQVNAQATVSVLSKPQYQHVRVVVVSSTGAGNSKIVVGMGVGKLISFHLRHVLADHTEQEAAFAATIPNRTTVVRATALQDGAATGMLQEFGDSDKSPTIKTDRADLAAWISQEICEYGGRPRVVNLTSVKQ